MPTTDENFFEIQRRGFHWSPITTMDDVDGNVPLGWDADPNTVVNGNSPGETKLFVVLQGHTYMQSDGTFWVKTGLPNTWTVVGAGGGAASVYGTNLNQFTQFTEVSTSAPHNTWVDIISDTTSSLVGGEYELSISYGWNHNATNSDFESRLSFNGVILGDIFGNGITHKQEPKDSAGSGAGSGSSQQFGFSRVFPLTLSSGAKSVSFDIRSDDTADLSTVWDVYIKLIRVA